MKHNKIFKAEDGSRYDIIVEICGSYSEKPLNRLEVYKCEPGKRKFCAVASEYSEDWRYRSMSREEQHEYRKKMFLQVIKREWLEEVLNELVEKMKSSYLKDWGE